MHEISICVKILFNFKKKIAWIKANLKTFNIAKNQEFELITSCHFKNLISPKIRMEQLVESNFLKKFKENPVNLDMGI